MKIERYLIVENSWDEWKEWFEEFLEFLKFLESVNEPADPKLIEWANFRTRHLNLICVWDKKTGKMFTM